MPFDVVQIVGTGDAWEALDALVRSDGTAAHGFPRHLAESLVPVRDLADAVHFLCLLHGRHPGVIDHAGDHTGHDAAKRWLAVAAQAFAAERAYLARLVAAAGPLPSTPGQAESEAAVASQRHALDMLAQSDRAACAAGAAIALALDWVEVRRVLDAAAHRLGLTLPELRLPGEEDTAPIVLDLAGPPARERALRFGAQQMLAQQRCLWDLLEARASARDRQ